MIGWVVAVALIPAALVVVTVTAAMISERVAIWRLRRQLRKKSGE